jgi:ribosomal protection tetracycline resistance protein
LIRTLNLGIVAHVDAGKTSLTERLLFAAGVIDEVGSVDDGSTQTDSLALERQRGITIKSAVVSFVVDDVRVNLIDTPGHPDFIAEVERVLSVLDGAVLVVSAVEGVQAQTRILMRALRRLGIPTLIFVNKIDRPGADPAHVLQDVAQKLTPAIVAMGTARGLGTRNVGFTTHGPVDTEFTTNLVEVLTEHDDALLAGYLDPDTTLTYRRLRDALAAQTGRALLHPVFYGSAITGAGVDALITGITELLPATAGDPDGPVAGTVFKVEREPGGEKIAYVAMSSGTVATRDRIQLPAGQAAKVTAITVYDHGTARPRGSVTAGQIGQLWGLTQIQIGDPVGHPTTTTPPHLFAPPTLETVIRPRHQADKGALHVALTQLAEQDPLINLRQDDQRQQIYVSLYGEVQKEVIQATLANDYHLHVTFTETTTICIERPTGTGTALELLGKAANPFLATIGLRIEPAPINAGLQFQLELEVGSIPLYVYKTVDDFCSAIEDTVRKTLQQGLRGWRVTDATVTMTHSGYRAPESTAGDFRKLTPLVLMSALKEAGTAVCEPIHHFHLDGPADSLGATLRVLAALQAVPHAPTMRGSSFSLDGEIPAARTHRLQQELRALTHGEGVLEFAFDHYRPVRAAVPARPRSDQNPLNRKEYLLHVLRRV